MSSPSTTSIVDSILIDADTVPAALRRLRRHAQLSATDLGRKAGFSQSKISRLENGHTRASIDDLRDLANALELPERTAARLIAFARDGSTASTSAEQMVRGSDPRIEHGEQTAIRRSTYSPFFIPPILQMPLYTEALLVKLDKIHRSIDESTQARVRFATEQRARRQLVLYENQPYEVYLRARCLHPTWVPEVVQQLQVDHITSIVRHTNLSVFTVHDDIDDEVPGLEEFTLLEFGDDQGPAVISESYSGPTYLDTLAVVARYESMLATVRDYSVPFKTSDPPEIT